MADISQIILLTLLVTSVYCNCPQIVSTGGRHDECRFRIHCIGSIRGVPLPTKCQASSNYPVNVELILTEATQRFDERIDDTEFLVTITTFRAQGIWPDTNLDILQYMPRLQNLSLIGNHIKHIRHNPFYNLNRLENLDLSHNKLSDVKDLLKFEALPNKLKKLNLAVNLIKQLSGDEFEELTTLVELDLSYNHISRLDDELLANLTSLEILKLNNNKIFDLNGALNNLWNLKHLFIGNNQIQNINDESLKIIYHLETFDVSTNQLQNLTSGVFSRHWEHFAGHSICKIKLSKNLIVAVPNATFEEFPTRTVRSFSKNSIDVLTELDLSQNSITDIKYNAFSSLVHMTALDLSCNKLTNFVVNANDLEYVKYLNLSANYLSQLYFESFTSMNNLYNLDLSYNQLDFIPEFSNFTDNLSLKYVNMTNNNITILKHIHIKIFHPDGGVLDLSNNSLSRLTIPLGEGLHLRKLCLSSNGISEAMFINLIHQNELVYLDMSKNYIELLNSSSLRLPVTVSYLDLSSNLIQEIEPAAFHRVGHLETLRLSHNNLSNIDYGVFQGLLALKYLDLSFNNILNLNSKVLSDLQSLQFLSVRSNGMLHMDYKGWLGHKYSLRVYVDGNHFSCEWLSTALSDYNNRYSRMRPCVLVEATTEHSVEGIPCVQKSKEVEELRLNSNPVMTDQDRLLSVNLQILDAIKDQTYFIKKFMWRAQSERK
ncbi:toll-like receptor 3 isoform X1 [Plodia interpunctella]|uniref:toll-like receptor 3 isoform X1 n=1 Tax=Plodia interpunctella TaxID=58824 RepID=UPI002367BEAF|nr:toll-like receptor 3 isoform X7 [Plodia interpunctella]XP_053614655.1 toll-like receptor 3 isoform X7 [Plodia interpunctella]